MGSVVIMGGLGLITFTTTLVTKYSHNISDKMLSHRFPFKT